MPKYCVSCGQSNPSEANFCAGCGHRLLETSHQPKFETAGGPLGILRHVTLSPNLQNLSTEGERRQVTVLRSDLSGYSALFEAHDPELVQEMLEPIRDIAIEAIAARRGLVTQFRGDEIIALFGAVVSENDARDAVQAALDLHERVKEFGREAAGRVGKELAMHTGISSGLVVIQPSSNRDGLFAISGDAVNTAARLAALAAPNEVLIGPATLRWIEPFFNLERLEPVSVKGKVNPITPYRVVGAYSERSPFEGRLLRGAAGFFGRALELAHLGQCLERARAGHGQIVAISAQPGLGKSRLVHEFLRGAAREDVTVLAGRCTPVGVNTPYAPWIDVAQQLLQLPPAASTEQRVAAILAACKELALDAQRHAPALCHLLAPSSTEHALPAIARGPARGQILWQALFALIRRSANRRPLVVELEDWHWADEASNQFLRHHLAHLASLPVLVVLTFRPSSQMSWPVHEHLTTLSLRPLEPDAIAAMVGSMFDVAAVPGWFTAVLHERTGGNPLFIEEVVRSLKDEALVGVQNGELSFADPMPAVGIPDTVQSAVLARLDRLEPAWRDILRRAAVIGREFSLSVLSRLVDADVDLEGIISELEELGFVAPVRNGAQSMFAFKHVIIQNVAYETLLLKQRRELHGLVAQAIEELAGGRPEDYCEPLAFHYSRDHDLDRAVRYLELAGDRAMRSFALESARNHYSAAIHLLTESHQRGRRIEISLKWAAASQFATSEEHIEVMRQALADATALADSRLIASCHYWLGRMHYGRGDPSSAVPEFETVLANAAHLNDDQLLGRAYCVLGRIALFTAEPARGVRFLDHGITILRPLGDLGEMVYSISSRACLHAFVGEFAKAEDLFAEALFLARQYKDQTNEALVLQQLSYARCLRGNWEEAIEAAENCLDVARKCGLPVLVAFAEIFHAYARWMRGEREAGHKDIVQAILGYQNTGYRLARSLVHGWCAEVCALQGDLTRAQVHADLSIGTDKLGDRFGQIPAYRALARIALQSGRAKDARDLLAKAIELSQARAAMPDLGITHQHAAEILTQLHERNAAAQHRAKAQQIFGSSDMPWWREHGGAHEPSTLIQFPQQRVQRVLNCG
ncbi:MAG TPA: AAA family ATPase [Xanthobacteraceae bacterium]|jgi:class 3 adenylate cyclase/tetratricopeptide (TPR) repeat protein